MIERSITDKTAETDEYEQADLFDVFNCIEEAVKASKSNIKASHFPPEAASIKEQLSCTARIMPQDDDTGGFFVAVFKKQQYVHFEDGLKEQTQPQETGKSKVIERVQNFKTAEDYKPLASESVWRSIRDYYGLPEVGWV